MGNQLQVKNYSKYDKSQESYAKITLTLKCEGHDYIQRMVNSNLYIFLDLINENEYKLFISNIDY